MFLLVALVRLGGRADAERSSGGEDKICLFWRRVYMTGCGVYRAGQGAGARQVGQVRHTTAMTVDDAPAVAGSYK